MVPVVVVVDVVIHLAVEVGAGLSRIQVQVVLFDGSPESFYPRIVPASAFTVHGDFDAFLFQERSPHERGVLRSLIGIHDLRTSIPINRLFQDTFTPSGFYGVADPQSEDLTGVHFHNSGEVEKTAAHGDVCDVGTPNLIGSGDLQSPQ